MKHFKLYEEFGHDPEGMLTKFQREFIVANFKESMLTKREGFYKIVKFPKTGWTVNTDGSVDVRGHINISDRNMEELPVRFGKVTGDFRFFQCFKLENLKGCPSEVGLSFNLDHSPELRSLEGVPKKIGEDCEIKRCPSLPRDLVEILNDEKLRKIWMKSNVSLEQFSQKYRGVLKGRKMGL